MRKNLTHSMRGYSLLEMMITLGVIVIVTALSGSFVVNMMKTTTDMQVASSLSMLKREYLRLLFNSEHWEGTIANNAAMACVDDNPAGCANDGGFPKPFVPHINNRPHLGYNPVASATAAFNSSGEPCTTFGTNDCYYRYEFTWEPACFGCPEPEAKIRLEFTAHAAGRKEGVATNNVAKYEASVRVSSHIDRADVTNVSFMCPAGQIVDRVTTNGDVYCRNKPPAN